jgi:hypothetical protein
MPGPGAALRLYQGDIMKKQAKKMVLAKETVRSLDALREVRGGSPTDQFWSCRVCYPEPISPDTNCAC